MLKISYSIIILILLSALAVNAELQQSIPNNKPIEQKTNQPQNNEKISTPQNNNSTKTPPFQKTNPPPNLQKETPDNSNYSQDESKKRWENIFNNPVDVFTGIVAIFTILLVLAAGWQVAVNITATRRQLRAYVFIDTIDVGNVFGAPPPPIEGQTAVPVGPWIFNPGTGPGAAIVIKNSGQTPAYNVVHTGYIGIFEYPNPIFPTPPESKFRTVLAMPPDGKTNKVIGMTHPLTPEEIDNLIAGTHAIYVYGNIIYKTFGKRRITNFRYLQNGLTATIGQTTLMTGCEEGNEAN